MPVLHFRASNGDWTIAGSSGLAMSEILHTAGIRFTAASGDAGAGGLCRLRVEKGKVNQPTSAELTQFLQDELREGVRLACQVRPLENARIRIEATPAAGEAL